MATIAVNACRYVCRSHMKDPILLTEEALAIVAGLEEPIGGFWVDLFDFVKVQDATRRAILEYVISWGSYSNLSDLAEKIGTSKATCSRTLNTLKSFLLGDDYAATYEQEVQG